MEKDVHIFIVYGVVALVVADLMSHGNVTVELVKAIVSFLNKFVAAASGNQVTG